MQSFSIKLPLVLTADDYHEFGDARYLIAKAISDNNEKINEKDIDFFEFNILTEYYYSAILYYKKEPTQEEAFWCILEMYDNQERKKILSKFNKTKSLSKKDSLQKELDNTISFLSKDNFKKYIDTSRGIHNFNFEKSFDIWLAKKTEEFLKKETKSMADKKKNSPKKLKI